MLHLPSPLLPPAQEDPLACAANRLRETLAGQIPGHERQWAQRVERALVFVEAAMRKHLAVLQDPNGFLAEVDVTRPTLARQADELLLGDQDIITQLIDLRDEARAAAQAFQQTLSNASTNAVKGIADLSAIRSKAEHLLNRVHKHGVAEMRLVQESVLTEIGVGD